MLKLYLPYTLSHLFYLYGGNHTVGGDTDRAEPGVPGFKCHSLVSQLGFF